jgi:hypothetical protein
MKNEIEVINGIKGEWRTVTRPEECYSGQPVRYEDKKEKYGYDGKEGFIHKNLFSGCFKNIQAFFPLPVNPAKRKVANVCVFVGRGFCSNKKWTVSITITSTPFECDYSSRKSAIRGAKRFCKAIGYECEIVKG